MTDGINELVYKEDGYSGVTERVRKLATTFFWIAVSILLIVYETKGFWVGTPDLLDIPLPLFFISILYLFDLCGFYEPRVKQKIDIHVSKVREESEKNSGSSPILISSKKTVAALNKFGTTLIGVLGILSMPAVILAVKFTTKVSLNEIGSGFIMMFTAGLYLLGGVLLGGVLVYLIKGRSYQFQINFKKKLVIFLLFIELFAFLPGCVNSKNFDECEVTRQEFLKTDEKITELNAKKLRGTLSLEEKEEMEKLQKENVSRGKKLGDLILKKLLEEQAGIDLKMRGFLGWGDRALNGKLKDNHAETEKAREALKERQLTPEEEKKLEDLKQAREKIEEQIRAKLDEKERREFYELSKRYYLDGAKILSLSLEGLKTALQEQQKEKPSESRKIDIEKLEKRQLQVKETEALFQLAVDMASNINEISSLNSKIEEKISTEIELNSNILKGLENGAKISKVINDIDNRGGKEKGISGELAYLIAQRNSKEWELIEFKIKAGQEALKNGNDLNNQLTDKKEFDDLLKTAEKEKPLAELKEKQAKWQAKKAKDSDLNKGNEANEAAEAFNEGRYRPAEGGVKEQLRVFRIDNHLLFRVNNNGVRVDAKKDVFTTDDWKILQKRISERLDNQIKQKEAGEDAEKLKDLKEKEKQMDERIKTAERWASCTRVLEHKKDTKKEKENKEIKDKVKEIKVEREKLKKAEDKLEDLLIKYEDAETLSEEQLQEIRAIEFSNAFTPTS